MRFLEEFAVEHSRKHDHHGYDDDEEENEEQTIHERGQQMPFAFGGYRIRVKYVLVVVGCVFSVARIVAEIGRSSTAKYSTTGKHDLKQKPKHDLKEQSAS